jgi:hypothetical protein
MKDSEKLIFLKKIVLIFFIIYNLVKKKYIEPIKTLS